jgi:hypothetical protein
LTEFLECGAGSIGLSGHHHIFPPELTERKLRITNAKILGRMQITDVSLFEMGLIPSKPGVPVVTRDNNAQEDHDEATETWTLI